MSDSDAVGLTVDEAQALEIIGEAGEPVSFESIEDALGSETRARMATVALVDYNLVALTAGWKYKYISDDDE